MHTFGQTTDTLLYCLSKENALLLFEINQGNVFIVSQGREEGLSG